MTRTDRIALVIAALAVASLSAADAAARETFVATDGTMLWGEIAGATAPIVHPGLVLHTTLPSLFQVPGLATDGTSAYVAGPVDLSTRSQAIYTVSLATGSVTSTRAVSVPVFENGFQDLAFVNGNLYGAWFSFPQSSSIRRINPDASTTTVFTASVSGSTQVLMAASDQSDQVVLIPTRGSADSRDTHILINANTWTTVQSVTVTDNKYSGGAALANLDGSRIIETLGGSPFFGSSQTIRTVPGFAVAGTTPTGIYYGQSFTGVPHAGPAKAMSDAIDLAYPPTLNAVAALDPLFYYQGDPRETHLVRRAGDSFSIPVDLTNFATPDDTTLDQVVATSLTSTQTSGGTPIATSATLAPTGDLSTRRVATATFTVPADATLVRGLHALSVTANLQARYTTPSGQETRPVDVVDPLAVRFAVDPANGNYVGNGDFSLYGAGWNTGLPGWIPSAVASQHILAQNLELGTPDSPMRLDFDYECTANTVSDLAVRLNGVTVASVPGIANSNGFQHFSIDLTDPALRNLVNPLLEFDGKAVVGGSPIIYVDNISLIAIPEPASLLVAACALPLLARRRRRR